MEESISAVTEATPRIVPRRPWLAALLSLLLGGPVGQIYAGRFRRSMVLWCVTAWLLPTIFLLSGIGTNIFSFNDAFSRGLMVLAAYAAGIFGGAVAAPVLLPWIPLRAFALKGMLTGIAAGVAVAAIFYSRIIWVEALALLLITMVISSYLAMNFTGSTPFTSPSGVEKEMRKAIPLQAAVALIALVVWVGAAFAG